MGNICQQGAHIIQHMGDGLYRCAECSLGFREHHELHIQVGGGAVVTPQIPPPSGFSPPEPREPGG